LHPAVLGMKQLQPKRKLEIVTNLILACKVAQEKP